MEQIIPIPLIIALEFGEYLYNLRAALDHLAYTLAVFDSKQDPPPREDAIQFPIYDTKDGFQRNEYRIEALSEKHREWIESVQPYMGENGPVHYLLHWLNDLARKDRHRQLHVMGAHILRPHRWSARRKGPQPSSRK